MRLSMHGHRFLVFVAAALLVLLATATAAFAGSPLGLAHDRDDVLQPRANAYRSRRTLMPFNYYSIPFCPPSKEVLKADKNKEDLGEILMGNRLVPTQFSFKVGVNQQCMSLCTAKFTRKDVRRANYMIDKRYDVRMFLDNMPLVSTKSEGESTSYRLGYSLGPPPEKGAKADEENRIHNHLRFKIRTATDSLGGISIVGFHVTPMSMERVDTCTEASFVGHEGNGMRLPLTIKKKEVQVTFTYSVEWEESDEEYEVAHSVQDSAQKRGHKIAAMYGVMLAVLAGVVVAFVMLRTVRRDLAIYLDEELDEAELREESGWKLVRGDVFRPPPYAVVLATLVGAGSQVAATVFTTMVLCTARVVNPAVRGHFLTTTLVVFLFTHAVSGFATSRLLKLFGMGNWKTAMACMVAFPLSLGAGILALNFIHWFKHTTVAIPFGTLVVMALLWVIVSLPFGAAGVFAGFQMDTIAVTAKVSSIPRLIPAEAGSKTVYYLLFGSLVPFVACCVELSYVLNAFWREERMYMFGLLTFFLATIALLCVEVGIVVTYFTLRDEDYRWWWRSFGSLAATGFYVFCYSVFFLKRSLEIRLFSSVVLFLSYMLGISLMFGLALGTISFLGALWLVQRMYAAIKAD